MMRDATTVFIALILGACGAAMLTRAGAALVCEDAHATVVVAGAEAPEPPRTPRTPRPAHPAAPAETPEPAEAPGAPAPPEALLDLPETPGVVTPRGWFGFGFECGECYVRTSPGDSVAVWTFGSHPRVYSVDLGSPAARAGLRRGDIITRIDGISILTPDGGRRFASVRPGQRVKWTVLREGALRQIVARAAERPDRRERVELRDLRKQVGRLNELSDLDQLRRELATLTRELNSRRAQELARERVRVKTPTARRLRYAGVIGSTEVEVRGPGSIVVSESDAKDELVINTGESVVLIRLSDPARKRGEAKPK